MPTQQFDCDQDLFTFLVRYPEVLVNIWDMMDITKVSVKRLSPYVFAGEDGAGTSCKCDLVYGNQDIHIYHGTGNYKGSMAPREITGRCVCILHSKHTKPDSTDNHVTGTMDVYLKLDNLGADLLTRTLGPFVGKTADYNFIESAKFVSQIHQVCERNPMAAQHLASRLDKVEPGVRQRFAEIAANISANGPTAIDASQLAAASAREVEPTQIKQSPTQEQPLPNQSGSRETSIRLTDQAEERSPPGRVVPRKTQIYMRR
jgi:hypothetical protein